jgi:uncharacterized membrane protein
MSKAKRNSLLLLSLAGMLVVVLAMSLPNLALAPGQPFSLGQSQSGVARPDNSSFLGSDALMWIFRGIMASALILLPFYVVFSLLNSEGRQRLVADVIVIALLLLIAYYLDKHPLGESGQRPQEPAASNPMNLEAGVTLPPAHFPANPPPWLALAVILAISALVLVFILAIIWFFRRRARMSGFHVGRLAETAQRTIESLQAGGDFEVIVIQCYLEMSRVVKEKRGVAREIAMTPREFEARLVGNGLPPESVGTLTRLFEQVRYGSKPPSVREENLALSCLTDIVNACQTIGVRHDG